MVFPEVTGNDNSQHPILLYAPGGRTGFEWAAYRPGLKTVLRVDKYWIGIGVVWTESPLTFTDALSNAGGCGGGKAGSGGGGYRVTAPTKSSPGPAGDVAAAGTFSCTHGLG